MSNDFKLLKVTDLNKVDENTRLPESDFSLLTEDNKFFQWEYIQKEEDKLNSYDVHPGISSISTKNNKLVLVRTSFTKETILEEYSFTKEITNKIDIFFSKEEVYKKYGIFPKRAILLYGLPGCGKSSAMTSVANTYSDLGDTAIVIWPTDKYEASDVKTFLKSFKYDDKVKRLIFLIEDLGGSEYSMEDRGRHGSESSLLALLDNVEQTFTIPTMIIATTNHPENFLENLTDRPQRFDDVMEIKAPNAEFRAKFMDFFSKNTVSDNVKTLIKATKFDGLSIAHIKEIFIRSDLYSISLEDAIASVHAQSSRTKKGFSNKSAMGFG